MNAWEMFRHLAWPGWYDVVLAIASRTPSDFLMFFRPRLRGAFLTLTLASGVILPAQAPNHLSTSSGPLQQYYKNSQELLRAGKLKDAADQFRAFLAGALGELAMGYGLAHDYMRAAPLFDEALRLEPDSSTLLLDYARTALMLGDPAHAKTLATEFIRKKPGDHEKLAQAHQVLGRALLKLNRDWEAKRELESAVALDPTFPNGYDLAVACLDLDDEKCAVQIFDELEKSFGDTPDLHMSFGRAYADSDLQSRAITEFRRAVEESPRMPGAHYLLAAVLLSTAADEQHVQDAEVDLKEELLISPHDSMTYTLLGKIALNRSDYPEAETYLRRATSIAPQSPEAYLYLGQLYFNTNRLAESEAALRRCVRLTTDVSQNRYQVQKAHYLLGRILMKGGQSEAAQTEMEIARDLANKTLAQDKSKLAGLMDTTEGQSASRPEAGADIPVITRTDPSELGNVEVLKEQLRFPIADSYNNLGAMAATNADDSAAVAYFRQSAVWNPSLEGLDYNWGRAAFAGSQFFDAIPPLSRYLKAHSDDIGARSALAISQYMTENYRGCMETLQPVIGKADLAPQTEYVYAESMIRTGQNTFGVAHLKELEKSHPEIPDVHRALGEALGRGADKPTALEELRTAIRLNPHDAESHYDLGKLRLESGDTTAAISELETAVRLSPEVERFHRELADAYTAARRPADAQKEIDASDMLRRRGAGNTSLHQAPTTAQ